MATEFFGQQTVQSGQSSLNATEFLFQQLLSRIQTMTLVKVMAVTNNGGVAPVGTVDVQIMVGQTDRIGNVTPHETIYALPYQRIQGGANAVIIDPQVGDIGAAGFCSRDISSVKASKAVSGPGSKRRFSHADGLYFGTFLGAAPSQYVQFDSTGITIFSPNAITVHAPNITLTAGSQATVNAQNLTINANTSITGTLTNNGVDVGSPHRHTGVQGGTGTTGTPI